MRVVPKVGSAGLPLCVRGLGGRVSGPGRRPTPLCLNESETAESGLGGAVAALRLRSVTLGATLTPFYYCLELTV